MASSFLHFLHWLNDDILALPTTILFLGVAVILTIKTRFLQFRAFGRFIRILQGKTTSSVPHATNKPEGTINAFQALCTAMAATIGTGNIVGPSLAIFMGGPGALFWLLAYIFFAAVTKYVEVTLALQTRVRTTRGDILGGPMQYLKLVHPFFATWYAFFMLCILMVWSSVQSNTLADILVQEGIPAWISGITLACIVYVVLIGGVQRLGDWASKAVPFMFVSYVCFALLILLKNIPALGHAIVQVFQHAFTSAAAVGGFAGAALIHTMHYGIYKGVFVTEAGLGTSSIGHALANTKKASDQGILAMYSMAADALLCSISGLLVLITGVWTQGNFRNTLIYEVFKMNSPFMGKYILICAITLFIVTTVVGNTFNGTQNFAALTGYRYVRWYGFASLVSIFLGALFDARLAWTIADTLITFVAIPNLLGILLLAFKKPELLQ